MCSPSGYSAAVCSISRLSTLTDNQNQHLLLDDVFIELDPLEPDFRGDVLREALQGRGQLDCLFCFDLLFCRRRLGEQLARTTSSMLMWRRCEGEVIVQGDEGPVRGVAQVVDCHGVTVGHQEREEEEEQQEVESDGEKTLKERCACPWMG